MQYHSTKKAITESGGFEPPHPVTDGFGLANRHITTLSRFLAPSVHQPFVALLGGEIRCQRISGDRETRTPKCVTTNRFQDGFLIQPGCLQLLIVRIMPHPIAVTLSLTPYGLFRWGIASELNGIPSHQQSATLSESNRPMCRR